MLYKTIYPTLSKEGVCKFQVWAPKAEKLHLVITDQGEYPMEPQQYGYWKTEIESIKPGTRYKYKINNSEDYPDPASLSQPDGVHEASEVIDLGDFEWNDCDWNNIPLKDMIQYELHTGTFTQEGSFKGIIKKLDYLLELGINTIELLPVAQFSGKRNWGYDGAYPFAVQNTYGGAGALMNLVNICHKKGIAVIMDVVYNHFGPEGCYVGNFGHYYSGKYSTPWGQPVNFDGEHSDGVRNYFIQNALMWCRDFHIDGLRLDAIHSIFDFSAVHIMQQLAEKLNELSMQTGQKHYLIAESHLNDVRYILPHEAGGYGLDAQWSDDFHHSVHTITTGEKNGYYLDFGEPYHLSKSIKHAFVYDGQYSAYRKKTYGNSTDKNSGEQFVIFNQNHDQIGNRLKGERLISLTGFETAKTIAGTMFLTPNVPMLFMGEEYGERNPFYYFVSHLDPELNRLVREGRKKEFKHFYTDEHPATEPDDPETFSASILSWNIDGDDEKQAMYRFYRRLIELRKKHPVLKATDKDSLEISEDGKVYVLKRWQNDSQLIAFFSFENEPKDIQVPDKISISLQKILDSVSEEWKGKGSPYPGSINSGDKITIQENSLVIYSNTVL